MNDEGFLWYGAVQTSQGEVPIRDFHAYDPGRYYWAVACFTLFRDQGIVALRVSCFLFEVLGLSLGLAALRRAGLGTFEIALAGPLLALWMWPPFRTFDSSLALAGVYFALRLLETPSLKQHFVSGLFVGIAAFFGRNHGVYAFAAFLPLILGLCLSSKAPFLARLAAWICGIAVGYSPIFLMAAIVPGFAESFGESIAFSYRNGAATLLHFPIPWPWRADYGHFSLGFPLLLLPLFYASVGLAFVLRGIRSALVACLVVGLPYLHLGYSRPDLLHLASAIQPALLGLLALPTYFPMAARRAAAAGLAAVLLLGSWPSVGRQWLVWPLQQGGKTLVTRRVGDDPLVMTPWSASLLAMAEEVRARAGPDDPILVLPYAPGLYPVMGVRSPVRNSVYVWPYPEEDQRRMVSEIESQGVKWILYVGLKFQGYPRFPVSHPVVWDFIQRQFETVPIAGPRECLVFHRAAPPAGVRTPLE